MGRGVNFEVVGEEGCRKGMSWAGKEGDRRDFVRNTTVCGHCGGVGPS